MNAHTAHAPEGDTPRTAPLPATPPPPGPEPIIDGQGNRMGHHLMMLACCIPMLLIVGALVVTGVAGTGAVIYALLCTAMMAAMMFLMPGHKH